MSDGEADTERRVGESRRPGDQTGRGSDEETVGNAETPINGDPQTETERQMLGGDPKGPGTPPPGSQWGPREAHTLGPRQRGCARETEAESPRR